MTGEKIRFRFRKADALRLISHLDTMRCFERMLRRASIPYRSTAGFHPTPRFVLALSLPLGVVGLREVAELELTSEQPVDEITNRLADVAPPGMSIFDSTIVPLKVTANPRRIAYRATIPPDRVDSVRRAADALIRSEKVWVERSRPKPRGLNIRPYLRSIAVADGAVTFELWVTNGGTARIDELVRLVGLDEYETELTRTELELRDEVPDDGTALPSTEPAETRPPAAATAARADDDRTPVAPTWGLSPNGPIVE